MNKEPEERADRGEEMPAVPPEASADAVPATETFFTRNIRLITFLVCVGLFLAFCGPVSVFTVSRMIRERTDGKNTVPMTVEECIRLSELPEKVDFSDLRGYTGRYSQTNSVENYYIEFGEYLLLATRNKTTGEMTVIVENLTNRERINLYKDDARAFFAVGGEENAA